MTKKGNFTAKTVAAALCCGAVALFVAGMGHADPYDEPFLPSEIKSFNQVKSFTTLSNEDLAIRADQLRYNQLSPAQRAMNYQWLSEHSGSEKAVHGGKAISKLLERHLKSYIDERAGGIWLKKKLMPDSSGDSFIKDVDYDLKLHSDKLVIGVTYEF